jgi:hypothetical protein
MQDLRRKFGMGFPKLESEVLLQRHETVFGPHVELLLPFEVVVRGDELAQVVVYHQAVLDAARVRLGKVASGDGSVVAAGGVLEDVDGKEAVFLSANSPSSVAGDDRDVLADVNEKGLAVLTGHTQPVNASFSKTGDGVLYESVSTCWRQGEEWQKKTHLKLLLVDTPQLLEVLTDRVLDLILIVVVAARSDVVAVDSLTSFVLAEKRPGKRVRRFPADFLVDWPDL